MEKEYKEWKAKHIPQQEIKNEEGSRVRLGQGYWQGFMCQHAHILQTKVVLLDSHCNDWTNPRTFKKMYFEVYEKMSQCGIAKKIMSQNGTTVLGNMCKVRQRHMENLPITN